MVKLNLLILVADGGAFKKSRGKQMIGTWHFGQIVIRDLKVSEVQSLLDIDCTATSLTLKMQSANSKLAAVSNFRFGNQYGVLWDIRFSLYRPLKSPHKFGFQLFQGCREGEVASESFFGNCKNLLNMFPRFFSSIYSTYMDCKSKSPVQFRSHFKCVNCEYSVFQKYFFSQGKTLIFKHQDHEFVNVVVFVKKVQNFTRLLKEGLIFKWIFLWYSSNKAFNSDNLEERKWSWSRWCWGWLGVRGLDSQPGATLMPAAVKPCSLSPGIKTGSTHWIYTQKLILWTQLFRYL